MKQIMILTRLNKFIAESGITSRRKAEDMISQGRISVNKKIVTKLNFKVNPSSDIVCLDGEKISPRKQVYFLLNKPKGIISTTKDEKNRKTVIDLIKSKEKIFSVGRLDYNTTGVLFLTNDGEFSNLLSHPKNKVPREYEVRLDNPLSETDMKILLKGTYINNVRGKFEKINFKKINDRKNLVVVCVEGRNHFVKMMFGALHYRVVNLNRMSFAGIHADIPIGFYRKMSASEISGILRIYGN